MQFFFWMCFRLCAYLTLTFVYGFSFHDDSIFLIWDGKSYQILGSYFQTVPNYLSFARNSDTLLCFLSKAS